jgi:hypothetical protein
MAGHMSRGVLLVSGQKSTSGQRPEVLLYSDGRWTGSWTAFLVPLWLCPLFLKQRLPAFLFFSFPKHPRHQLGTQIIG